MSFVGDTSIVINSINCKIEAYEVKQNSPDRVQTFIF